MPGRYDRYRFDAASDSFRRNRSGLVPTRIVHQGSRQEVCCIHLDGREFWLVGIAAVPDGSAEADTDRPEYVHIGQRSECGQP